MTPVSFADYAGAIARLPRRSIDQAPHPDLAYWRDGDLSCYYAPFEHINREARIILVGITPGRTQMNEALNAAQEALARGASIEPAMRQVKRKGSFSGDMRRNIVALLNRLGYQRRLGIDCSSRLWDGHDHLVHFCSLLRYPVYINNTEFANYNGSPSMLKTKVLREMIDAYFVKDLEKVPRDAILLPLGDKVLSVVQALSTKGVIPQTIMQFEGQDVAPPHPSPANQESINLVLAERYEPEEVYAERMYRDYLATCERNRESPKKSETQYKNTRRKRWRSCLFIRRAYGII